MLMCLNIISIANSLLLLIDTEVCGTPFLNVFAQVTQNSKRRHSLIFASYANLSQLALLLLIETDVKIPILAEGRAIKRSGFLKTKLTS